MERNNGFGESRGNNLEDDEKRESITNSPENIEELENTEELENELGSEYLKELDSQINLENDIISDFLKTNNFDLRDSLLRLRKIGEESLKNLSEKIVDIFNSNKLTVFLRDNYISRRGEGIKNELEKKKKLTEAEDYDSYLKLLQSSFWASSSAAQMAFSGANRALEAIVKRFPEKTEEILELWPKLFRVDPSINHGHRFNPFIEKIKEKEFDCLNNKNDRADYIKSADDFLALKCLKTFYFNAPEIDVPAEVEKRLDSIILKYPDLKQLPSSDIKYVLFEFSLQHPDRIMADSRRIDFIFKLWIQNLDDSPSRSSSSYLSPILINRLKNCSQEESDNILKILSNRFSSYHYISDDLTWLIDSLPVEKKDFKKINKKNELAKTSIFSLKKNKVEGKNVNNVNKDQVDLLFKSADLLTQGNEVIFLSNLIVNYPDSRYGIDEKILEDVLDLLIKNKRERFSLQVLQGLSELMSRQNWPDSLRTKVFSMNTFNGSLLNSVMEGFSDRREIYMWIYRQPLLFNQLELDFHSRADKNDLRHHFYEVLDNKKRTNDLDDLIKAYARSEKRMDFEELKNLFLNNRISRDYIQYFIANISTDDLSRGLKNNSINKDDTIWFLESAIKHGKAIGAVSTLKELLEVANINEPEKRLELIDTLTDNVLSKIDESTSACYQFNKGTLDFLNKPEEMYLGKKVMTGALDLTLGNNVTLVFDNISRVDDFFETGEEKKDYLVKAFNKFIAWTSGDKYLKVLNSYFSNSDVQRMLGDSCSVIEDKIFSTKIEDGAAPLVRLFDHMNEGQRESFITYFEKNYNIAFTNNNSVSSLCCLVADIDNFNKYKSIYKRIYTKLINDPALKSDAASILFNEDIIFNEKDLSELFFANIVRWPQIDGVEILESLSLRKKTEKDFSLSSENIKMISSAVMKNRGLSPRFWQGYLSSNKENPDFYLDKDLFKVGLDNISDDCSKESSQAIVEFLKLLSASEFEFKEDDIKKIITLSFKKDPDKIRIKDFYNYNQALMEDILLDNASDKYLYILEADINYSPELNKRLFDCIVNTNFSATMLGIFLNHFKRNNNLELINEFKKSLVKFREREKNIAKKYLLNSDLLDVEESKQLYKEVILSSDNPRTQILNSIDIIGSMLSNRNNINHLEKFLDESRPEDVESLKNISIFINKYDKENKGRTIAVMLFAREYLPERSLNEVVNRVATYLRKYEEVIEKNSYKNIPEGLKASIGMEYEITSSTDKAYQELTSRPSLASDIAIISEAARIGSGNDAVYEIATKPTDNPYLMLLEMGLLHDIEYVDLNFNRSEYYQKGARGFHLTIGGEKGLVVNQATNFLQNSIIAASWGGVQAGETGHKVNGGRGVSLRGREAGSSHNVPFFDKQTSSVELRSLSIDTQETLQRAVTTAFNGAIAIQAFEACFQDKSLDVLNLMKNEDGRRYIEEILSKNDKKVAELARTWLNLITEVDKAANRHKESFLDDEMFGYLDDNGVLVDNYDFGGQYNKDRFESIITNIDPTLSLKEYVNTTQIDTSELFNSFSVDLSDKLIKINNLYLKPGTKADGEKKSIFKGDHANAMSMLKTTKLDNANLEDNEDFFDKTIFDTDGKKRKGYYCLQGASELMLTHAVQRALMDFNSKIETMVN